MHDKKTLIPLLLIAVFSSCSTTAGKRTAPIETTIRDVGSATDIQSLSVESIGDDIAMLRTVRVTGSFHDLGAFLGRVAIARGYPFPVVSGKDRERNERIIALYRDIYPVYLEELQGVAEAYGRDMNDIDLSVMENRFFARMGYEGYDIESSAKKGFGAMCSVVGKADENGNVFIGRNLDTFNITGFLVRSDMTGVYRTLNTAGEAFHHYAVDGINEEGLFIGEMSITDPKFRRNLSPEYPAVPSVYSMHMMRIVLDTCANVDEAIALFRKTPVWFTHDLWHFYLADAKGNFCVVEWDEKGEIRFIREETGLVATNTALIEGRSRLDECARYGIASRLLAETSVRSQDDIYAVAKAISYRRDNPHFDELIRGDKELAMMRYLRTVWTTTYDLTRKSMTMRHQENGFREYGLSVFQDTEK